jgi:hypothetical protein
MYATARNAACCEEGLRPIAARAAPVHRTLAAVSPAATTSASRLS